MIGGRDNFFGIPLGVHTFTGLWARDTHDVKNRNYSLTWQSDDPNFRARGGMGRLGGWGRHPILVSYLGPSVYSDSYQTKDDLRVTNVFDGILPQEGDIYNVSYFDWVNREMVTEELFLERSLNGGGVTRQRITSKLISWQGKLFEDHIVGLFSARRDNLKTYADTTGERDPDGRFLAEGSNFTLVQADENLDGSPNVLGQTVDSITWSVVARFPEDLLFQLPAGVDLSAYYNESENFNPQGLARNIHGDLLSPTSGETKEYGLLVELFDRRVSMRLNWFETKQMNIRDNAGGAVGNVYDFADRFLLSRYMSAQREGIPFGEISGISETGLNSYEELYEIAMNLFPGDIASDKNYLLTPNPQYNADGSPMLASDGTHIIDYDFDKNPPPGALTDTATLEAKGFELEVVGNIGQLASFSEH